MDAATSASVGKSGQPQYFSCSHDGCPHTAPQSCGPRIMLKHECRFQLHAEHYRLSHNTCKKCIELTETGEWTAEGGRDDFMCRHSGCGYYSSSPRPANRKQAVERHEVAFPIHYNHFIHENSACGLCRDLLDNNVWTERDGEHWLSKGNNQVIARLSTKEQQNGNLPPPSETFSKRKGLKATITRVRAPPKKSNNPQSPRKSYKRKRDDKDTDLSREAAETLFGLYLVASARVVDAEPLRKRQRNDEYDDDASPIKDGVGQKMFASVEIEADRKHRLAILKAQIMETISVSGSVSPRRSPRPLEWSTTSPHNFVPLSTLSQRPTTPETAAAVAMLCVARPAAPPASVRPAPFVPPFPAAAIVQAPGAASALAAAAAASSPTALPSPTTLPMTLPSPTLKLHVASHGAMLPPPPAHMAHVVACAPNPRSAPEFIPVPAMPDVGSLVPPQPAQWQRTDVGPVIPALLREAQVLHAQAVVADEQMRLREMILAQQAASGLLHAMDAAPAPCPVFATC